MPIIDIERVLADGTEAAPHGLAQALADAAGAVVGSAPGRTWVRLRALPAAAYAENEATQSENALPVFVSVLHAYPPSGDELVAQVAALTNALAAVLGCDAQCVHVQMAPAGAGRQAFGGSLVA